MRFSGNRLRSLCPILLGPIEAAALREIVDGRQDKDKASGQLLDRSKVWHN